MAVMATATPPSLRQRMHEGYVMAAVFALESWADACVSVEHFARDVHEHGPSVRHGRAIMRRDRWAVEAERCELIADALDAMA